MYAIVAMERYQHLWYKTFSRIWMCSPVFYFGILSFHPGTFLSSRLIDFCWYRLPKSFALFLSLSIHQGTEFRFSAWFLWRLHYLGAVMHEKAMLTISFTFLSFCIFLLSSWSRCYRLFLFWWKLKFDLQPRGKGCRTSRRPHPLTCIWLPCNRNKYFVCFDRFWYIESQNLS